MAHEVPNISSLLIQNLAAAAARKGGLLESEAVSWAKAQSERILCSRQYSFSQLEQIALNRRAAQAFWLKWLLARG